MNWKTEVVKIAPNVVKIETPSGQGTGFFCGRTLSGFPIIATARHVIVQADKWQQPIRVYNHTCDKHEFVNPSERVIFIDASPGSDSAMMILFSPKPILEFPEESLAILPDGFILGAGDEVAWLGFPNMEVNNLCFFSGVISCHLRVGGFSRYLIDGVAIHGVSGGPVVCPRQGGSALFIGIASAYYPNRATGEALPGLMVAEEISIVRNQVTGLRDYEEAQRAQQKQILENAEKLAAKPETQPS